MAASTHADNQNAALNNIKNNVTRVTACSQAPATYTEANATYALANVTVASTDFTLAAGDVSGRKITFDGKTGGTGTATGTADHLAFLDVTNSKVLHVLTCTSKDVASGAVVNFAAVDLWEIEDPA
jgi:hypothetical protein